MHGWHHHHRRRHRRGRHFGPWAWEGRFFERGEVALALLSLLESSPKHGYELMRQLEERRTLTITVEPFFAAAWLVQRLGAFKSRNPEVDVLIDSSMRIVDLEREAADIGIRYGMKRDGILPETFAPEDPVDPYATDRAYWRSLWHQPVSTHGRSSSTR